jgi:hypothetical protein
VTVLVLHRVEHLGGGGLTILGGVPFENRPDVLVLDLVVVVQHVGEALPPAGQGLPGGDLAQRRRADRRLEAAQVAPERVVHQVHRGLVVGTLGHVGLAGEADLLVELGG